jgi:hypothetical protein
MFVYKTINKLNDMFYIGMHVGSVNDGYLGSGTWLKRAIAKYGKENFHRIIIEECDTFEELAKKEIYWIALFKDFYGKEMLYNIVDGGEGFRGRHTKETCSRMSKSHKDIHLSDNHRQCISKALSDGRLKGINKGREQSIEVRMKRSKTLSDGRMAGKNSPNWGKKQSEEANKKRSIAMKGKNKGKIAWNKGQRCLEISERQRGQNNPMSKSNRERRRMGEFQCLQMKQS